MRFGRVLYILSKSSGEVLEVTHARKGINGQQQVFLSKCDKDLELVAPSIYLGSWVSWVLLGYCGTGADTVMPELNV